MISFTMHVETRKIDEKTLNQRNECATRAIHECIRTLILSINEGDQFRFALKSEPGTHLADDCQVVGDEHRRVALTNSKYQ